MYTAFDTTFGRSYRIDYAFRPLQEIIVTGQFGSGPLENIITSTYKTVIITGYHERHSDVLILPHPLLFNNRGEDYFVIDIRPYIKGSHPDYDNPFSVIKNLPDFWFTLRKSAATVAWCENLREEMRHQCVFAGAVFSGWLAESMNSAYYLSPKEKMDLYILFNYYYQCLFYNLIFKVPESVKTNLRDIIATQMINHTKIAGSYIYSVLDIVQGTFDSGMIRDINDLATVIPKVMDNERSEKINVRSLYDITSGAWYGPNKKDNLAVALEHPPTWMAIVRSCIGGMDYNKSPLVRTIQYESRRTSYPTDRYTKQFDQLLSPYIHFDRK